MSVRNPALTDEPSRDTEEAWGITLLSQARATVRGMKPASGPGAQGTLFVVATPIGNLDDLSPRALSVLRAVPWIACEDTRVARRLRTHFGLTARLISYHDHNEAQQVEFLLGRLRSGEDLALICDAGTPLISDPGYRVVRAARTEDLPVRTVPGPSAVASALSVSGLPTDSFTFFGFRRDGEARSGGRSCSGRPRRPGRWSFSSRPAARRSFSTNWRESSVPARPPSPGR